MKGARPSILRHSERGAWIVHSGERWPQEMFIVFSRVSPALLAVFSALYGMINPKHGLRALRPDHEKRAMFEDTNN
jgi:hypothetical protein